MPIYIKTMIEKENNNELINFKIKGRKNRLD